MKQDVEDMYPTTLGHTIKVNGTFNLNLHAAFLYFLCIRCYYLLNCLLNVDDYSLSDAVSPHADEKFYVLLQKPSHCVFVCGCMRPLLLNFSLFEIFFLLRPL